MGGDDSHRRCLEQAFFLEKGVFDAINDEGVYFLNYESRRLFELSFYKSKKSLKNILFKGVLIKRYFKVTNESSSLLKYFNKIKGGKLKLSIKQFENYVSKIKMN